MEPKDLLRCFDSRYILQTLFSALVLVALALVGRQFHDGSPARITIGVAETLVFATMIVGTLVPIRNLDELHQRIHLIAIAAAFGLVGIVVTGMAFIAKAGVRVPPLGLWLWVFMVITWGVSVLVVSRRYR